VIYLHHHVTDRKAPMDALLAIGVLAGSAAAALCIFC
jgi:hypothetical protein